MKALSELCQELKNWFERKKVFGVFSIENGTLSQNIGLKSGQYFRIVGSIFNDGVHKFGDPNDALIDEDDFDGAVWLMAIPPEVVDIANELDKWIAKNCDADSVNMTPLQSESFGGYSYQKGSQSIAADSNNISAGDWRSVFGTRLNKWRKI